MICNYSLLHPFPYPLVILNPEQEVQKIASVKKTAHYIIKCAIFQPAYEIESCTEAEGNNLLRFVQLTSLYNSMRGTLLATYCANQTGIHSTLCKIGSHSPGSTRERESSETICFKLVCRLCINKTCCLFSTKNRCAWCSRRPSCFHPLSSAPLD
jgi:hypothetical protein